MSNVILSDLFSGMAGLSMHGAKPAATASATGAAAAGALAPRVVTPYTAPLQAVFRDMPNVLCRLIESYLKPQDTELLLNATFIDFMAASPQRDEARLTLDIWARMLPRMDYSRVYVVVETGLLPLCAPIFEGDQVGKVGFREQVARDQVTSYIPLDPRVVPDLVRIAHARYFPHVREVVSPAGRYTSSEAGGSAALQTTEELHKIRAEQADYPADIPNEHVVVQRPVRPIVHEAMAPISASKDNPTYVVTLNLQPTKRAADGQTVLDQTQEPRLQVVRHDGIMRFEWNTMVDHVVMALPPEFAEVPVPAADEAQDAPPVADENGYFG